MIESKPAQERQAEVAEPVFLVSSQVPDGGYQVRIIVQLGPQHSFSDCPVAKLPAQVQAKGEKENFYWSKVVIMLNGRVGDQTPAEQVDSQRGEGMEEE